MRNLSRFGVLCAAIGATILGGCSSTSVRNDQAQPEAVTRDQARAVTIRKGDGSGIAAWDDVVADMASADVVLFGEMHGHPLGLAVAQELYEDILVANPKTLLSMEFYERDQQLAVDDYLSGVTNRKQFEKAAHKDKANNPPGHVRMIDATKEAHRPMIAANAPRRYVTIARKEGYDRLRELNDRQRAMFDFPIGDQEGGYKDRFMELMGAMGGHSGSDVANGMFRSQSLWDATMAQSIIDGLQLGSPVAHVVGYFHVQFGMDKGGSGLIDQIRLRSDRPLKIVSIIQLARDDQPLFMGKDEVRDENDEVIEEAEDSDSGISTYVVYVGAHQEE